MMNFQEVCAKESFQITETFNGGAMGLVHRARHLGWNIDVAIKHPLPKFLRDSHQISAFHTECETWASLGLDPYIATCYYSREIAGLPCVIAEFLAGGSVQDAISDRSLYRGGEEDSLSRILTIAASTAWGLARAHKASLIHCDVKPGNMLLTEFGYAKIADFGLTVAFRQNAETRQTGLTEAFAAPEQLNGWSISPAVDVWGWAASMLAVFTGGMSWQNGAVCGAALGQFINDGGKAYRIPPMPEAFAVLLTECFERSPDARIIDFSVIAARVCVCHEELFGEPCPASRPDLDLISADSLNNRAVSRFDLGDIPEVHRLLDEALTVDPLHSESNFNSALLGYSSSRRISRTFLERLEEVTCFALGEYRPWIYRAYLLNLAGQTRDAMTAMEEARKIASINEMPEIERLWHLSNSKKLNLVLAPPISGEDFAHDSERFRRLMSKAELALREDRVDDARRYLLMSGDILGFGRHPHRRRLLSNIETISKIRGETL